MSSCIDARSTRESMLAGAFVVTLGACRRPASEATGVGASAGDRLGQYRYPVVQVVTELVTETLGTTGYPRLQSDGENKP